MAEFPVGFGVRALWGFGCHFVLREKCNFAEVYFECYVLRRLLVHLLVLVEILLDVYWMRSRASFGQVEEFW